MDQVTYDIFGADPKSYDYRMMFLKIINDILGACPISYDYQNNHDDVIYDIWGRSPPLVMWVGSALSVPISFSFLLFFWFWRYGSIQDMASIKSDFN